MPAHHLGVAAAQLALAGIEQRFGFSRDTVGIVKIFFATVGIHGPRAVGNIDVVWLIRVNADDISLQVSVGASNLMPMKSTSGAILAAATASSHVSNIGVLTFITTGDGQIWPQECCVHQVGRSGAAIHLGYTSR